MFSFLYQPQYVFIHDAIDELITCGDTSISSTNLRSVIAVLHNTVPGKDITGYQKQFQVNMI